jgi:hypothetical protein
VAKYLNTITTSGSATTSNIVFYNSYDSTNYDDCEEALSPIRKAADEDPIAWLRRRVDEVCFKAEQ